MIRSLLRRRGVCRPGRWPADDGRPRVLVESRDAWAFSERLELAGFAVVACRGPDPDTACPLLVGGACAAAGGADIVVSALAESDDGPEIVSELAARYPRLTVVAEAPRPKASLYADAAVVVDAPLEPGRLVETLERVRP